MPLHALFYEYVGDILELRKPHREAHLALVGRFFEEGRLLAGGALGDPPTGALIVVRDAADAEAFRAEDPYIHAGLVTKQTVVPWNVVAGPWTG
jgi:uncharacterized protein YciI